MKKLYTYIVCALFTSTGLLSQTTSDSHRYIIPKKATLILETANDAWSPALKNHELPVPESGIDEKLKEQIKDSLTNRYPRKKNWKSWEKTSITAPPAMLRNFLANSFSGFVPNDNDMAVSNNGTVCSVTNVNIWTKNLTTNIS